MSETPDVQVEKSSSDNLALEEESDEEIDTFVTKCGGIESASITISLSESSSFDTKEEAESQVTARANGNELNVLEEQASQVSEKESYTSCEIMKCSYESKLEELNNSLVLLNAKIVQKEEELALWKKKFEDKCIESKIASQKIQGDLTARLEKALRMLEAVKNEKEAAVMKYVVVEQEIATKEKAAEMSEKRRQYCEKEAAQAMEKAKQMQSERTKFRQLVEDKENELIYARKENDKLKCDNATLIQKLKGLENRLQKEVDSHAETQSKVAILNQKLKEMKEEFDVIKKHSQDLVKAYKSLEIDKNDTDDSIKSCASSESDISSMDENTPSIHRSNQSLKDDTISSKLVNLGQLKDFEFLKRMQQCSMVEITSLRDQLSQTKKDSSALQMCLREKTEELMVKDAELSSLKSRVDAYAVLEGEAESERRRREEVEQKRTREQALVNECEERINQYQSRERANLEYTSKLTNKITELQLEVQEKLKQSESMQQEIDHLKKQISEAKLSTAAECGEKIFDEKRKREEEGEKMAKLVDEKETKIKQLLVDFEEKENKWNIEKRKFEALLRDSNRQLQSMKKLKESVESELTVVNDILKRSSENSSPRHSKRNSRVEDDGRRSTTSELIIGDNCDSSMWESSCNTTGMTRPVNGARKSNTGSPRKQMSGPQGHQQGGSFAAAAADESSSLMCASVQITQPFKGGVVQSNVGEMNMWTDKYPGLDKNSVVEKLIKTQKQQKKLIEKSEVMEDQVFHLTEELKKKNRIIQYYVLREETGTLGTASGKDTLMFNKIYAKKMSNGGKDERKRKGGGKSAALSALFHPLNGATLQPSMGLEGGNGSGAASNGAQGDPINLHFYKELNTRLQSVLEDTILKNMKLQENLDKMSCDVQALRGDSTTTLVDHSIQLPPHIENNSTVVFQHHAHLSSVSTSPQRLFPSTNATSAAANQITSSNLDDVALLHSRGEGSSCDVISHGNFITSKRITTSDDLLRN